MKKYSSYKDSGVEWIGVIPEHWKKVKFKWYVFYQEGPGLRTFQFTESGIRVICVSNITSKGIDFETTHTRCISLEEYQSKYLHFTVNDNDILLSSSGSIGKVSRYKFDGEPVILNTSTIRLHGKTEEIDSDFVPHYLSSDYVQRQLRFLMTGGVVNNFGPSHLDQLFMYLPPLTEQLQIVSFLDDKIQKIDSLIQQKEKKIELLTEKRLKLVEEVLLNPNTKRIRLEHVVNLIKRPIEREENKIYTKIGMYNWGRGIFKYPSELGSELGDSSFNYLEERDLLLSGQFSWEGSVSIVENEENNCISSHRFHILNGKKDKILNEYLWSYFTSQEGHFILNENSPGSAGRNRPLNIRKLLKEKIPVPEIDVQMKIKRLVIETRNFEKQSKKKIDTLKEYRQSLISEVVTGKVRVCEEDNLLSLNSQIV